MCTLVALESTETFVPGQYLSLSPSVSSIMRGNSGFSVGSPSPEKVIESILVCRSASPLSFASSAERTSSAEGILLSASPSRFQPHSQYMQSNEHILPSLGRRFIPSDEPRRRLKIGPNTVSSLSISELSVFVGLLEALVQVGGVAAVEAGEAQLAAVPGLEQGLLRKEGYRVHAEYVPDLVEGLVRA